MSDRQFDPILMILGVWLAVLGVLALIVDPISAVIAFPASVLCVVMARVNR